MPPLQPSTQEQIKCVDEKGEFTVYTSGFPYDVEPKEFDELFGKYGKVRGYFPLNRSGKFTGVIFIKYENREMAEKAIEGLNQSKFHSRTVTARFANSATRSEAPRDSRREESPRRRPYDDYREPGRDPYDDRRDYYEERRERYPEDYGRRYDDRRYDDYGYPPRDDRRYPPRYPEDEYPPREREERRYPPDQYRDDYGRDPRAYREEIDRRRYMDDRRRPSPPRQYRDDYPPRYPDERDREPPRYPDDRRYYPR